MDADATGTGVLSCVAIALLVTLFTDDVTSRWHFDSGGAADYVLYRWIYWFNGIS
jgi:hypothetical protein